MIDAPDNPMIVKLQRDGYVEVPEPLYDIYDSEIGDGEKYYENEYGEALHPDNVIQYLLEEKILIEKTR